MADKRSLVDRMAAAQKNVDTKGVKVRPSNAVDRIFMDPATQAVTSPWSDTITYSPEANADASQDDLEQTLTHEMVHQRQKAGEPWYAPLLSLFTDEPYERRPREMEAFQAERDRAVKRKLSDYRDPITGRKDIFLQKRNADGK